MSNELLSIDGLLHHAGWLRRIAAALVGDRDAAEDVTQDTMLAAWRRPPETDRDVRPWLVRVARNNARDRARADTRRKQREQVADAVAAAEVSTPEQLLGSAEIHRTVAEIVSRLEAPLRETVVMRYYDGLTAETIARRQGLPAGTVRARLKRALDQVRAELDARHGGDRRTWLRALLPLVPVPPPAWSLLRKGASVALGAAVVAVTVVAVVPAETSAPEQPTRRLGHAGALKARARPDPAAAAGEGGSDGRFPASALTASGPPDPGQLPCPDRLRRAHEELVALEADLADWDLDFLFGLGKPNPDAESELAPLLIPALNMGRWQIRAHRLRCPTWACRLTVLFTEPRADKPYYSADRYRKKLADDGTLATRLSDVRGQFREWQDDLVAGEDSSVYVVHVRLRQPSAAPLPDAQLTPPARPLAVPPTAASCESAAAALAQELPARRARWEEVEPIDQKFERSQEPPDPELVGGGEVSPALVLEPAGRHRMSRPPMQADQQVPAAGPHVLGEARGRSQVEPRQRRPERCLPRARAPASLAHAGIAPRFHGRILRRMPRMQVYLPDDLYNMVKEGDLPASVLLQNAVRAEVRRRELMAAGERYTAELARQVGKPTVGQRARAADVARRIAARSHRKAG